MLIIPLHRAPTWDNVPWVTIALICANVFVFAFLQSGDARVRQRALDYYAQQALATWEFPAYRDWLREHPADVERTELFERFAAAQPGYAAEVLQSDDAFLARLRAGELIAPQAPGHAQWRERRGEFDRLWNAQFSERWMIHFSELSPRRMVAAMFMHGSIGHLLGNMLFLALLGLLVEGALGHRLFLALYLLGGFGSAVVSVWWRWGDVGSALGASGAIAALMGAYCVLWGTRRVRFFWWFFVAFDYVKAPALVLLPFWLGWELVNLAWNEGAHVGFDAHAAGIVVGALLALGVRALHWERRDFLEEDTRSDVAAADHATLALAREHIGRLQTHAARALLEPLCERNPEDFDVRIALYRCARCEPGSARVRDAALEVVRLTPTTSAEVREQKAVHDDYVTAIPDAAPLPAASLLAMARRWPAIGAAADAARVLARLIAAQPATPGLESECLALARDLIARGETAAARSLLEALVASCASGTQVEKARWLLANA